MSEDRSDVTFLHLVVLLAYIYKKSHVVIATKIASISFIKEQEQAFNLIVPEIHSTLNTSSVGYILRGLDLFSTSGSNWSVRCETIQGRNYKCVTIILNVIGRSGVENTRLQAKDRPSAVKDTTWK